MSPPCGHQTHFSTYAATEDVRGLFLPVCLFVLIWPFSEVARDFCGPLHDGRPSRSETIGWLKLVQSYGPQPARGTFIGEEVGGVGAQWNNGDLTFQTLSSLFMASLMSF